MEDLKIHVEKNTTEVNSTIHDLQTKVEKDTTEVKSTFHNFQTKIENDTSEVKLQVLDLQTKIDLLLKIKESDNIKQLPPSGQTSPNDNQNIKANENLNSVANTEQDKLCHQILKKLSPFIQGSLTRYLSNQSSGSNIYDEVQKLPDDKEFLDKLVNELLPAIQTLARSKVAKNG